MQSVRLLAKHRVYPTQTPTLHVLLLLIAYKPGLQPHNQMNCLLTSQRLSSAMCSESSCNGMMVMMPCMASVVVGTSRDCFTMAIVALSPVLQIRMGLP